MCLKHFPDLDPEVVRCAACKAEPEKAVTPDDWWIVPSSGAKTDPGEVLLMGIMEGHICPNCMTSRLGIGCVCSRNELGLHGLSEAQRFLDNCVEGSDFTEKEAGHIMTSTVKRAVRRMELDDETVQDLRSDAKASFNLKPSWFPPRNAEPTHLPI